MPARTTCQNCLAFDPREGDAGLCRRAPPVADPRGNGIWPMVHRAEWCLHGEPHVATIGEEVETLLRARDQGGRTTPDEPKSILDDEDLPEWPRGLRTPPRDYSV